MFKVLCVVQIIIINWPVTKLIQDTFFQQKKYLIHTFLFIA